MLSVYNLTKNEIKRVERVMKRGQLQFNIYMAPELVVEMAYNKLYSVETVKETIAVKHYLLNFCESLDDVVWRIVQRVHSNFWLPNM